VTTGRRARIRVAAGALSPLVLALARGGAASDGASEALVWRSLTVPVRGGEIAALAFDPVRGSLAIADSRGVLLGRPEGPLERRLRRGDVRDLAFLGSAAAGSLLAATARGLFLLEAGGAVSEVSPGPGAASRAVNRIAVAGDWIAVASDDGVAFSRDARRWETAASAFPAGAATALALRVREGELECWAVIGGEPWSARLASQGGRLVTLESLRETVSFGAADGGPVELVLGPPGADVAMVYPTALVLREAKGAAWRVLRLDLPPGAAVVRYAAGLDRLFLATPRGLLVAPALEGPWRLAGPPAGSAAVRALAGGEGAIFVGADAGLLAGGAPVRRPAEAAGPPPPLPEEPGIDLVHRAVLAYLRLGPMRMDGLYQGASRRGWLPIVAVHGGLARDTNRAKTWDEAISGGSLWQLVDRDRDRTDDYDVGLTVSWDLGDIAYEPELIDVSREAREVIELRDDVLDETTQLYFERRRVLAELAALAEPHGAEALRLRLRADELAAGIDAWTGGWFARHTRPLAPGSFSPPRAGP
jgi:hypothetical protein